MVWNFGNCCLVPTCMVALALIFLMGMHFDWRCWSMDIWVNLWHGFLLGCRVIRWLWRGCEF